MNILFIGPPRVGKTTIGKAVAGVLKRPFIDTDSLITSLTSKKPRQHTLPFFRRLEEEVAHLLVDTKNSVISLGGGTLLSPKAKKLFESLGPLIYLQEKDEILMERYDKEALYLREGFLKERRSLYERCCKAKISVTGKTTTEVTWEAIRLVSSFASQHGENHTVKRLASLSTGALPV